MLGLERFFKSSPKKIELINICCGYTCTMTNEGESCAHYGSGELEKRCIRVQERRWAFVGGWVGGGASSGDLGVIRGTC